jgi:hypothetical protein
MQMTATIKLTLLLIYSLFIDFCFITVAGGHELHTGAHTAKLKPGLVQPTRNLSITQAAGSKVTTSSGVNSSSSLSGGGSKLQELFHHRQIKSKGYDNVATSSSMMFSIEGTEDDDEDI